MHGEAPPPFDGEEAGLMMKTMQKMIYTCTYRSYDISGQSVAVLDIPQNLTTSLSQ